MKKISICLMMLIFSTNVLCQDIESSKPKTRKEYLALASSQTVAGFIFLGAGITTLALLLNGNTSLDVLPIYGVLSLGATLGSMPFFIAAARNKRKAMKASASLQLEQEPFTQRAGTCFQYFPAISMKITF